MSKFKDIDLQAALFEINAEARIVNTAKWEEELTSKGITVPTDNQVMTAWETVKARRDAKTGHPLNLLKQHISKYFDTIELLDLKDFYDTLDPRPAKLLAFRSWINTQRAKAAAKNTNFDTPPDTYGEIVQEINS